MKDRFLPFILATICFVHFSFKNSAQSESRETPYYELILSMEPENNLLKNKMTVIIDSSRLINNKLHLNIANAAKIDRIEGEDITDKQIFTKDGILKHIILTFASPTKPKISFKMVYELEISDTLKRNKISKDWIELNGSSFWFPSFSEYTPFTYSMQLALHNSYQIITGDYSLKSKKANNQFLIMSRIPRTEIAFSAAKGLYSAKGEHTLLYAKKFTDKLNELVSWSDNSLKFLNGYIEKPDDFNHKRPIILSPFDSCTYGLKNYIVLNAREDKSEKEMCRLMVYEFSRYWFSSANPDSKHAWLSESFAEYLSLIFLRDKYGNLAFEEALEKNRKEIVNDTTVLIAYEGRPSNLALHQKGPLILHHFEQYIGEKRFKQFLNLIIELKIDTNEKLYNLISTEFDNPALDELHRLRSSI